MSSGSQGRKQGGINELLSNSLGKQSSEVTPENNLGSLKIPKDICSPTGTDETLIFNFTNQAIKASRAKKNNHQHVSYREGADEYIEANNSTELLMNSQIFEKKQRQIYSGASPAAAAAMRGSFTFFNIADMQSRQKEKGFEEEGESFEILNKNYRRIKERNNQEESKYQKSKFNKRNEVVKSPKDQDLGSQDYDSQPSNPLEQGYMSPQDQVKISGLKLPPIKGGFDQGLKTFKFNNNFSIEEEDKQQKGVMGAKLIEKQHFERDPNEIQAHQNNNSFEPMPNSSPSNNFLDEGNKVNYNAKREEQYKKSSFYSKQKIKQIVVRIEDEDKQLEAESKPLNEDEKNMPKDSFFERSLAQGLLQSSHQKINLKEVQDFLERTNDMNNMTSSQIKFQQIQQESITPLHNLISPSNRQQKQQNKLIQVEQMQKIKEEYIKEYQKEKEILKQKSFKNSKYLRNFNIKVLEKVLRNRLKNQLVQDQQLKNQMLIDELNKVKKVEQQKEQQIDEKIDDVQHQKHSEQQQSNNSSVASNIVQISQLKQPSKFKPKQIKEDNPQTIPRKTKTPKIWKKCCRLYDKFRLLTALIINSKICESLVIVVIIANSIVIAIYDRQDRDSQTKYNQILDNIQLGTTIFFTIECLLKMFAQGIFKAQNAYFRDLWNWVDFFTIIVGWLEFVPYAPNLKFVRTLRVLKPMRSIHAVPGLKRLINSLLKSLALLANVIAFLVFFIIFFGIVGVSFFKGKEYYRCHYSINNNSSQEFDKIQNLTQQILNQTFNWTIDKNQPRLCSLDGAGYRCSKGTLCFNPGDYNLEVTDEYRDLAVHYGMQSFNNLVISLSTIFQCLTLEGWVFNMYNMMDAGQDVAAPLYFLLIVILGSFFLMNLILAAIMDSFSKVDKELAVAEFKREFLGVQKQAELAMKSKVKILELMQKQKDLDIREDQEESEIDDETNRNKDLFQLADNIPDPQVIQVQKQVENDERIEEFLKPVTFQSSLKRRQISFNDKKLLKPQQNEDTIQVQPPNMAKFLNIKNETKVFQKSNSVALDKENTPHRDIVQNQKMGKILDDSILDSLFTDQELDNEDDSLKTEENLSQLGRSNNPNHQVQSPSRSNSNANNPSQIQGSTRINNIYEDQGGGVKVTDGDGARGAGPELVHSLQRLETRRMKKERIEKEKILHQQSQTEQMIRSRSEGNSVYQFFYSIATNQIFNLIIFLTISLNTIVIMMDKYPQTEAETDFQELANNIFYFIFLVEMVVKLFGFGFFNYLRDSYNIFDAFIIICSTIEIALQFQEKKDETYNKPDNIRRILLIFRPLRFLRIFKIARQWKSLNQIVSRLSNSFKQMINFTILLSVFIFIFSLLGMELYSNVIKFNADNNPLRCVDGEPNDIKDCLSKGKSLRINFDNLQNAARAVFVIIVGDDWNSIMDDYVRATNYMSIFFFIMITIFGNIVLMTLFLAIFLREFDNVDALRDENMVTTIQIKQISSKLKRKLTLSVATSVQIQQYVSSMRCCKCLLHRMKVDHVTQNEEMGETKRALNLDLENQNKEQVTDQAEIENDQKNHSKFNFRPLSLKETGGDNQPNSSQKSSPNALVNIKEKKTQVPGNKSANSLLSNMLFIDKYNNSKSLTKNIVKHDPHLIEQIDAEINEGKKTHPLHTLEEVSKVLLQRSQLAEKKLTTSIAEEAKQHQNQTRVLNNDEKHLQENNSLQIDGQTYRNQAQIQQVIQPIEQKEAVGIDHDLNGRNSENIKYLQDDHQDEPQEENLQAKFSGQKVIKKMVNIFNQAISQKTFEEEYMHQIEGQSLFIFSRSNQFRIFCLKVVESKSFKFVTFCLIILSTVSLGMQDPLSDPNSQFNINLYYVDLAICLFFILECVLQTIGRGLYFNGEYSYLTEGWNKLDFIVVIMSILSFFQFESIKVTKTLRNLRVIRPLRMITKNKGLKIAVESLANSIKGIINITIFTLMIYFVFGILGVNFFKGLYYRCYSAHLEKDGNLGLVESIETKWDCISSGGEWINRKNRFDNVFNGAFVLFQISTTEGWYDVMMQAVDSTHIDQVPEQDHSPLASIFFISFIFIGGQFTMNLFQSVVISTYMLEKEQLTNNHKLTEMQQEWVKTQIKCYNSKPIILHPRVKEKWRIHLIKLTTSLTFDQIIFCLIAANTLVLSLNWFLIDPSLESSFEICNHVFTAFFTLEAIVKIVANGALYFKENWNLFDFFVLLFTYIQIIYQIYFGDKMSIQGTFVRVLKFLRALRIVRRAERLKKIAMTLILSLPSMAHIAFMLFLLVIFYSMLGMNLFGRIMLHDALNEHANFQNFATAFLTMMRCSTGEGWNDIMLAVMDQKSILFQCQELNSYEDDIPDNNGQAMQCGNYWVGLAFFLSYMMFVSQIFLNLFIAIILDGFDDSKQEQNLRISDEMLRKFQRLWADFDPEGTGFIPVEDLENLICSHIIDKTHWIRGGEVLLRNQKLLQNFICLLELQMYQKYMYFSYYDVISRFAQTIFKVDFEKFVQDHYNRVHRERMKNLEQQRKMNLSDDLRSISSHQATSTRSSKKSSANIIKNLFTMQDSMELIKAGIGNEDIEELDLEGMQWMAVSDMLIFETFEDFYLNLVSKITQNSHDNIALSEDLYREMMKKEDILKTKRDYFDSRIFSLLPCVVRKMRKLVEMASERKRRLGNHNSVLQAKIEIDQIAMKCKDGHIFKTMLTIPLAQNDKTRQDMFQIFAKTMDEEPQSQSPSSGLNWVKQNVTRAITLMKIQEVQQQQQRQLFQSKTQINPNIHEQNQDEQEEVDLQSMDQGQQRGFVEFRRQPNNRGDDFTYMSQRPVISGQRRGVSTTTVSGQAYRYQSPNLSGLIDRTKHQFQNNIGEKASLNFSPLG